MRWTPQEYEAYERKRKARADGVCASNPKPIEGKPLERRVSGEKTGRIRARIIFRIYSVRPADWDGYHIKPIQDCLGYSALLDGDDWNLLQGEVISEKAHSKESERTEIELIQL